MMRSLSIRMLYKREILLNRREELETALTSVQNAIEEAKNRAGRTDEVTLVCVTKTYPAEDIQILHELGVTDFGENKVQEITRKAPDLPESSQVHMIGSLQTNKVKAVIGHTALIQSLDRVSLLEAIAKRAQEPVETLIEVNIASDDAKAGMSVDSVIPFLEEVKKHPSVLVKGIMVMGTHTDEEAHIRDDFKRAKELFERLKAYETDQIQMEILSMGMSYDYEIAIEEGSTMVRIGSAILGERR